MLDAIVYCSKCGHTKAYAQEVADKLQLPIYSLKEANVSLNHNAKILYFGWIRENIIQGYDRLSNFYVDAVAAVGIRPFSIEMLQKLRYDNQLFFTLFYLRGGITKSKLSFKDKWNLRCIEKHLAFKQKDSALTEEEQILYDCIYQQKDETNLETIEPILKYYRKDMILNSYVF